MHIIFRFNILDYMNAGKRYNPLEFAIWTRRTILFCLLISTIPVLLFHFFKWGFLSIPWQPIAVLGTAVAFIVGFKNNASYNRLWEARQIYGGIINDSRSFAVKARDFLQDHETTTVIHKIFDRHFAWLTFLRYQLREPRVWETLSGKQSREYMEGRYRVPEWTEKLEDAVAPYLSKTELDQLLSKKNRASQVLALQSAHINELYKDGAITDLQQLQLQQSITSFYDQQGKAERIKNFPYPRHFSSITTYLLHIFVYLLPFGLLKECAAIGAGTTLEGYSVFLLIPLTTLIAWVFVTLDAVGENSLNPFEGGANDVPITQISKMIETDLKEMLDRKDLPEPIVPVNNILM